jgi:hypothetical protein
MRASHPLDNMHELHVYVQNMHLLHGAGGLMLPVTSRKLAK